MHLYLFMPKAVWSVPGRRSGFCGTRSKNTVLLPRPYCCNRTLRFEVNFRVLCMDMPVPDNHQDVFAFVDRFLIVSEKHDPQNHTKQDHTKHTKKMARNSKSLW